MKNISLIILLVVSLCVVHSCSEKKIKKAYGMVPHFHLTSEEIRSKAPAWNFDMNKLYMIDTAIIRYMYTFGPEYSFVRENHIHPLQAIYYNKEGRPVSFITGAFADAGLRNLKWNSDKNFEVFPPRTLAKTDDMFYFEKHLSYVKNLDGSALDIVKYADADYNVLVQYAEFPGRQTKRFLKEVLANQALSKKYKVNYFFVNTDNMYPEDQR